MAEAQANTNPEYLNLKVKSQVNYYLYKINPFIIKYLNSYSYIYLQDGEEVFFKIKRTTQFKKLMDAYCQR